MRKIFSDSPHFLLEIKLDTYTPIRSNRDLLMPYIIHCTDSKLKTPIKLLLPWVEFLLINNGTLNTCKMYVWVTDLTNI